jgi:hypothetical protein
MKERNGNTELPFVVLYTNRYGACDEGNAMDTLDGLRLV